jgi:sulfate transport system substrate-binding protein
MTFIRRRGTARAAVAGAVLLLPLIAQFGLGARAAGLRDSASLTLVAYSTPKSAYDHIIPDFQKTKAGKGVTFSTSYGPSGDQSRAVSQGLGADVVEFSLEPDMTRLVTAGLVDKSWNNNKYHGFVTDSIVTFVVRPGNPKRIHTWSDLLKKGVSVITPNPFQSGGAQWNLMAAYGAQLAQGKKPSQALAYLKALFKHIAVQDSSSRNATNTWAGGKGDVLISYENEALGSIKAGIKLVYITPPQSILIENPVAAIKSSSHLTQAKAFVKFLYTDAGQNDFGLTGYRPVVAKDYKKYSWEKPKKLFKIGYLGGWTKVEKKFFDPQSGLVAQIERDNGVSP